MGLFRFKPNESRENFTLLNGLTALRLVGGLALGSGMVFASLSPTFIFVAALGLAATDGEGLLLKATHRFEKFQKMLRIQPSKLGRKFDPIADKVFAASIIIGGLYNRSVPSIDGGAVMLTEFVTACAAGLALIKNVEVEVSKIGTWSMAARCATIGFDLAAAALRQGNLKGVFQISGHLGAMVAVVFGVLSCFKLMRQILQKASERAAG